MAYTYDQLCSYQFAKHNDRFLLLRQNGAEIPILGNGGTVWTIEFIGKLGGFIGPLSFFGLWKSSRCCYCFGVGNQLPFRADFRALDFLLFIENFK